MFKRIVLSLLLFGVVLFPFRSEAIDVSAHSAIVMDADSGDIVFEKNAYAKLPMASTTKIMTAYVALIYGNMNEDITITQEMVGAEGSSIYLKEGEILTLEELLYALLLESANDAAEAIAIHLGGSIEGFSVMMNEVASKLQLKDTRFENPHGLDDENHYTTAYDLAKLTSYALVNPDFKRIVSTYNYVIRADDNNTQRNLVNHNRLLKSYDGAIGVKTGFTKRSGRCLVSAAERDGITLVCVTIQAPNDWNDHRTMLDLGFDRYSAVKLAEIGSLTFELPVIGGSKNSVSVSNWDEMKIMLNSYQKNEIECVVHTIKSRIQISPIEKNEHLADAVFYLKGKEIARLPLYSTECIPKNTDNK